jgi:hypothetical protein
VTPAQICRAGIDDKCNMDRQGRGFRLDPRRSYEVTSSLVTESSNKK